MKYRLHFHLIDGSNIHSEEYYIENCDYNEEVIIVDKMNELEIGSWTKVLFFKLKDAENNHYIINLGNIVSVLLEEIDENN